ncbi:MAG: LON peptidase substrate-binding domain-containing protein, partial [Clostridia bacterium]|nr:LON peptidase substrate-binding domain-containing protein [Clostridia bacterium]
MTNETIRLNCMALRGIVLFPGTMEHFDVGRPKSLKAIMNAHQNDDRVFVVCQKNPDDEDPSFRQLYDMGCLIEIKQVMSLPDGTVRVLAMPLSRARMLSLGNDGEVLTAEVEIVPPDEDDDERLQAALKLARQEYEHYLDLKGETGGETRQMLLAQSRAGAFSDKLAANVIEGYSDKQSVLEAVDPLERTILVCAYLHRESENLLLMQDVQRRVQSRMERSNREYFLREQQRVIDEELGEEDDEAAGYEKKLASLPMNDEARERTAKEIKRLKRATPQSPEAAVMENYIEYMLELPWGKYDKTLLSIPKARKVLEKDHYGLEEVKKRILEYLAVRSVKQDAHSPILCLVGAPGVGKTSIARSVARALGKRFCQVSLGGVHDEAELRGHRRTYVAAMPGRVISAIKQCGSMDPVFLFDEIDKMASDMRGDPAAAMLEILDPEQNARFRDHYLEAPFDL